MIREAYQSGFNAALEKLGGAATNSIFARARSTAKALEPEAERVLDYSGWAPQPMPYRDPTKIMQTKPLTPKAAEAMRVFNYRPGGQ